MRPTTLLPTGLLCFLSTAGFAADLRPIAAEVQRLRESGAVPATVHALHAVPAPADAPFRRVVAEAVLADAEPEALTALLHDRPAFIRFDVPLAGGTLPLLLYRVDPFAEGFTVRTDAGVRNGYIPGAYYRGILEDDPTSIAAFSFFRDQVIGMVSSSTWGNVTVQRMLGRSAAHHIVYSDRDLLVPHALSCGTADVPPPVGSHLPSGTERTTNCVRLYYELAYDVHQLNGSDVTQSTNWITAAHNNVATLFANDGIQVSLSEVFVWTEPEAFTHQGDQFDVDRFAEYRSAFNGDVANFISSQFGSGFARGVGGLCAAGAYETSPVLVFEEVPGYSAMVTTITHEIGHVCGSHHTHACVWNGNNTQIDDCGHNDPFGYLENMACYDSLNPILPVGHGTIMSYCGIDLTLGFGPQPAERMQQRIDSAPCLGTDCIHSCSPSIDSLRITDITPYSAVVVFHENDPSITQWEIQVLDDSQVMIDWTTITSTTYPLSGLWAGHTYQVRVRSTCPAPWSSNVVHVREFSPPATTCGHEVYDSGGAGDPYLSSYNTLETYYPDLPGNKVTLTFQAFGVEPGGDFLRIYNGADTTAALLGSFTGDALPGPITSTAASGALTLSFLTDGPEFNPYPGWEIAISCAPNVTTGITALGTDEGLRCSPNPVDDQLTVEYDTHTSGPVTLELLDLQGRAVRTLVAQGTRMPGAHRERFTLGPIAHGAYTLRLIADGTFRSCRLVK